MTNKPYTVLVGVDFSELADRALLEAFGLASKHPGAEVHVVSVLGLPTVEQRRDMPPYAMIDEARVIQTGVDRVQAHAQLQMEKFAAQQGTSSLPFSLVCHVTIDTAVHAIAQLGVDIAADLIVVGTHNRKGIERLLLGSVAEGTVRHAHCPVLVIPSPPAKAQVQFAPTCPGCLQARADSGGKNLWCAQHSEHHGRRHTYHQSDRSGTEANFPLTFNRVP